MKADAMRYRYGFTDAEIARMPDAVIGALESYATKQERFENAKPAGKRLQ